MGVSLVEETGLYIDSILETPSNEGKYNISTCICIRKCNKNGEFSPFHFWPNLARDHVL